MSNDFSELAKKSKKTRFAVQKNIHLFFREMLRYYDIYLLFGVIVTKTIYLGLTNTKLGVADFIVGIMAAFEFFLIFARVGIEYQRKKKQINIFEEMTRVQLHLRLSFVLIIICGGLWNNFSFNSFGLIIFTIGVFIASNRLLAAAAVTIHTKDVEFAEKIIGMKKNVLLYDAPKTMNEAKVEIIEEKKPYRSEFKGVEVSDSDLKKRFQNCYFHAMKEKKEGKESNFENRIKLLQNMVNHAKVTNAPSYEYMRKKFGELTENEAF